MMDFVDSLYYIGATAVDASLGRSLARFDDISVKAALAYDDILIITYRLSPASLSLSLSVSFISNSACHTRATLRRRQYPQASRHHAR